MSKTGIIVFINTLEEEKNFSKNFSFKLNIFEKILDFEWIEPTVKKFSNFLTRNIYLIHQIIVNIVIIILI